MEIDWYIQIAIRGSLGKDCLVEICWPGMVWGMKQNIDKMSCFLGELLIFPDNISGLLSHLITLEARIISCWLLWYGNRDIVIIMSVKLSMWISCEWLQSLNWEGSPVLSVFMRLVMRMAVRSLGEGSGSMICPSVLMTWKRCK